MLKHSCKLSGRLTVEPDTLA